MSTSRYSTSTSKHQILSPSFSSNQLNQKSSLDQKNDNEANDDDEIELYKALKASEDQFKLENQLKIKESNEIEKAIEISKTNDSIVPMSSNNHQESSRRPSRLPPGARYPIEKDYLIEDELLSIAIKLSLEERDHWNSIQAFQNLFPPPLPNRLGDREGRKVPDIPNGGNPNRVLPITIPPPLPPRKKLVIDNDEDRFDHHHHHQDLSDEFSDSVSLDSDDESNSFDGLSIHSSHYNNLDSTTNLIINPRNFVEEENYPNQNQPKAVSSNELQERDDHFFPTRKSSLQDSFVTAIDENDRNSVLDNNSIHQTSSFISKREDETRKPIYQKPKIPNKSICSSDTIHQLEVIDQGFRTPNESSGFSDTIHQVRVNDQDPRTPIADSSHSIHQLEIDDQRSITQNRFSDPSDTIRQLGINNEESRRPRQDSSDPIDQIYELENNSNENEENQSNEISEDLMNSIQSIAKINYIKTQEQEGNEVELMNEIQEIDVENCDEILKVSNKKSIWIETKTCSELLKWLMWWGEIKIENDEISKSKGNIRGMIKIKLDFQIREFQSSSRKSNEQEDQNSSKLTCKIEILKDFKSNVIPTISKPNEQGKKKVKRESLFSSSSSFEYLIEDPFMLPCRFSNIVIRLFTLIQLSNLANLTKPNSKQIKNANFFELKRLGESIQLLENQRVNENLRNTNGNGLIERLRDRLKRLKKVDQVHDGSNPNTRFRNSNHNPLEVVDRSQLNGIDDQDRIRWLPIL